MKTTRLIGSILGLILVGGGSSWADDQPIRPVDSRITVRFAEPESFSDVRDSFMSASASYRTSVLDELREFLQSRADSMLRPGLTLEITVTDVDLAGEFEPWNFAPSQNHVRVVKEIYPVRISLQFKLTDSTGAVLASGERRLNDFGRFSTVFPTMDSLRYEKEVLRTWLAAEFRDYRKA